MQRRAQLEEAIFRIAKSGTVDEMKPLFQGLFEEEKTLINAVDKNGHRPLFYVAQRSRDLRKQNPLNPEKEKQIAELLVFMQSNKAIYSSEDKYTYHLVLFASHSLPRLLTHDALFPWQRLSLKLCHPFSDNENDVLNGSSAFMDGYTQFGFEERSFLVAPGRTAITVGFWNGVSYVFPILWTPAFWGMFIYDIIQYVQFPENRYGMTTAQLVWGLSPNYYYRYAALSSNLGSDLPGENSFFIPAASIAMAAFILGTISAIRLSCNRSVENIINLDMKSDRSLRRIRYDDIVDAIPFLTRFSRDLTATEVNIIWNNRLPEEVRDSLLERLIHAANHRQYLAKWQSIAALGNILYHCHGDPARQTVGNNTLEALQRLSPYFYGSYQLWSAGHGNRWAQNFWYMLSISILFASLRWWILVGRKIDAFRKYNQHKQNCEDENKIWSFAAIIGGYTCTPCKGDYVDYKNSQSGQSCLDALLSNPHNPEMIINELKKLIHHGPFSNINFSKQHWNNWALEEWQSVFEILMQPPFLEANIFNLSSSANSGIAIYPSHLTTLANYLSQAETKVLDLAYQLISLEGMQALLPGLNTSRALQVLNVTAALSVDEVAIELFNILSNVKNLRVLNIGDNGLSNEVLPALNQVINQLAMTELYAYRNLFSPLDLTLTLLTNLDISNFDLSAETGEDLGQMIVAAPKLQRLNMANCGLSDPQVASFFPFLNATSITQLGLAGNSISWDSMQVLTETCLSLLTELDVNDNNIDDIALNLLNLTAKANQLKALHLSGNIFLTASGVSQWLSSNADSLLQELHLARIPLGDAVIPSLVNASAAGLLLTNLDLEKIELSQIGAEQLFTAFPHTLKNIKLSHNPIQYINVNLLYAALKKSSLHSLMLQDTQLPAENLKEILPMTVKTQLKHIDVSFNALDNAAAINLSKVLVTSVPEMDTWLNTTENNIDFNRELSGATSQGELNTINLAGGDITSKGAKPLCLVLPSSSLDVRQLNLVGNPIQSSQVGIPGCPWLPVPEDISPSVTSSAMGRALPSWQQPLVQMLSMGGAAFTSFDRLDKEQSFMKTFIIISLLALTSALLTRQAVASGRKIFGLFRPSALADKNMKVYYASESRHPGRW